MKIRNMTIDDYDKVFKLWMSCSGMALNDVDDSKEGIGRFLKRNPNTCFVAEDEGEIVGVILGGNDGRRGYIHHAAVKPDCRSRGIGGMLTDAVERAFRAEGVVRIFLLAFNKNEVGNAFWGRKDYTLRDDLNCWTKVLIETNRTLT